VQNSCFSKLGHCYDGKGLGAFLMKNLFGGAENFMVLEMEVFFLSKKKHKK
jgi:hypothetical protein